jgi:hypothetical protein
LHGLTHELGRDQVPLAKVSPDQGWFSGLVESTLPMQWPTKAPALVRGLCAIKLSNTTDSRRIPTTPALGVICGDSPCLPRWKRGFPHARTNGAEIPDGLDGIRSLIVPVVDTCQDPLPGPCRFAELRSLVKLRDCLELSKASIVQVSRIAHLTCVDGGSVPLKPSLEPCRAGPRCQRRIVGEPGRVRPGANEVCRRRPARAAGRPVRRGREGLGGAARRAAGRTGGPAERRRSGPVG